MLQLWDNGPLVTWTERNSLIPSDTPARTRLLLTPGTYQHNPTGLTFFWFTQMQITRGPGSGGGGGGAGETTLANHLFDLHKKGVQVFRDTTHHFYNICV